MGLGLFYADIDGILPKGMADRALLAGYPRYMKRELREKSFHIIGQSELKGGKEVDWWQTDDVIIIIENVHSNLQQMSLCVRYVASHMASVQYYTGLYVC